MTAEAGLVPLTISQSQQNGCARRKTLEQHLDTLLAPALREHFLYPSPPMSHPPSPSKTQSPRLPIIESGARSPSSARDRPRTPFAPGPVSTSPVFTPILHPSPAGANMLTAQAPIAPLSSHDPRAGFSLERRMIFNPEAPIDFSFAEPSSSRAGRKSKAHVTSACINCKRAHLSCDVQRPCVRCVSSGKQDTCFDVQHKKRGRPRLREEGELKGRQIRAEGGNQAGASIVPTQATRPIISTRHRRADSFRSVQSQASTESPTFSIGRSGFSQHSSPPGLIRYEPAATPTSRKEPLDFEVATALLDLDFVIIKANQRFEQIMLAGQSARGRPLSDVAIPVESESLQTVRAQLRAERDARDPAYMPPILHPGLDPLHDISENNVDLFTRGYSDQTYTWTHTHHGSGSPPFPARVRLGKSGTYFVAVTLPGHRPFPSHPPSQLPTPHGPLFAAGPPPQTPESYLPSRRPSLQFAPSPSHLPPHNMTPPTLSSRRSSLTYPPPPSATARPPPTHALSQPDIHRLPVAEPPTDTTPFPSRPAARAGPPYVGPPELQLAPIISRPAAAAAAREPPPSRRRRRSRAETQRALPSASSHSNSNPDPDPDPDDEDKDEDDGPSEPSRRPLRKRQRMGIDDVLQS